MNLLRVITYTICLAFVSSAQGEAEETLADSSRHIANLTGTVPKRIFKMTNVSVPLIIGGLIVKGEDTHFRNLRNDYMPHFNRHIDDYLQYVPATVMIGLKVSRVESKNSWSKMLVADAFSALLMASTVNTLKHTTKVKRPDGSNKHSFPSGHTATAFMTATMLTKEYGQRSAWVGIGAYSVATATGLMRMANNKHWLSDVIEGAGIGIMATELGYFFSDIIFKKESKKQNENEETFMREEKPSFFSLYVGTNLPLSRYDLDESTECRTSSGSTVGIEGAYFFNPYIGVGGRFTASNTAIIINNVEAEENTFDAVSTAIGGYTSYPLTSRWLVGGKLLTQWIHYPRLHLAKKTINHHCGFGIGSGISLTYKAHEHYGMRLFLDYNLQPSHSPKSKEWMNTLTTGIAFNIY